MLTREDNEAITRVGPGTLMGNLMRQYWIPAALSSELASPDSDPLRVLLLGEKLIAFRDTNGKVGLVQNHCPHRGASLFFGRNEECGLRCVYHGWKFDTDGNCVDMPNEPAESDFKHKVKALAYPTRERGGVIWAYLGPRQAPGLPELPSIEANMLGDEATASCQQQACNWLQILEGDIDTSHFGFLHRGSIKPDSPPAWISKGEFYVIRNRAPRYKVMDTEYGTMYGAYVDADEGNLNWRIALFMLPFFTKPPGGSPGALCRVPMDDTHTLTFRIGVKSAAPVVPLEVQRDPRFARLKSGMLPNTSDWYGRFRMGSNLANDFEIDRALQRQNEGNNGYTGIVGNMQDPAITESEGELYDRSTEHLGSSDSMIIRTRRRLLDAARDLAERGVTPPGVDTPEIYLTRSTTAILPKDADWLEATAERRRAVLVERTP